MVFGGFNVPLTELVEFKAVLQRGNRFQLPTLNLMEITQIDCAEEEILETAAKLKITFYDAAYVHHAKAKGLSLITEDVQLQKKITHYVNSSKIDDIIKPTE